MNSQACKFLRPSDVTDEVDRSLQPEEEAYYFSITGFLLATQYTRTILPDAQSEALGRAVLRYSRFLIQDMLLDPATSAEIVREFIREWVKK